MYLKLSQHTDPVKGFRIGGKLTHDEFRTIGAQIEEAIEQYGVPVCVLIEVRDLQEVDPDAVWEDLKFSIKHWGEISHLALVGAQETLAGWAEFGSRLIPTKVQRFAAADLHDAWEWLRKAHQENHAEEAERGREIGPPQNYKVVLAAIDLAPSSAYVAACAKRMAKQFGARLYLMHVVDFQPAVALGYGWEVATSIDTDPTELEEPAVKRLTAFARDVGLEEDDLIVSVGDPKFRILEACEERKVDLIVIGSRARHGLGRLLGSTANGVVHRADRDVLTVRIPRD